MLDIPVVDPHAGIDLAAVMPDLVPGTVGRMGQFDQGAGVKAAVEADPSPQQVQRRFIEGIGDDFCPARVRVPSVAPAP